MRNEDRATKITLIFYTNFECDFLSANMVDDVSVSGEFESWLLETEVNLSAHPSAQT